MTGFGPLDDVRRLQFHDDGATPNSHLPVLHYHLRPQGGSDAAAVFEALFQRNHWTPLWRAGIFDYHHYHSTAHEALAVVRGEARVTLGGAAGQTLSIGVGDVLVLPAGTGHRCVESSRDFLVVGAYPRGQEDYDIQRPGSAGLADSKARIARVALPEADPVAGPDGPLVSAWA
ncbi:cupin domain-containing protein [Pseudomonas sp. 148P]|uniref:Cupin domain-containing protein n=1 Tax=Pseudomonas ulcerans TaxID=3115852 RepID=A0ABU7HR05_9PSED|nr:MULTISPECIES: cupin domain-containing protein [unclassified Pseudomonas]MEE1923005.1 cupin domain-containing protein [Pseudomonas sp. 147P]MEE1933967.1 cupin domain-containing protein [Pseudomonas sp. 148P]